MRKRQSLLLLFLLIPLFLGMSEEHSSSNFLQFLGKTVNFLVLFGGLAYLLYKPLRNYLEKRSADVARNQEEAQSTREAAEEKLRGVEDQVAKLDDEVARIKAEAVAEGEREKERILGDARREAEKIKRFTQAQVEMYVAQGMRELREHAANLAIQLAQQRLRERMTPEQQAHLIDASIEKIAE